MAKQDGIDLRITEFCNLLTDLHVASVKGTHIPDYYSPFYAENGQKYSRIVVTSNGQRSVYCFVDLTNGDILKNAGWKAPAKGKRGSIWNDDCDVGLDKPCNIHGAGLYRR